MYAKNLAKNEEKPCSTCLNTFFIWFWVRENQILDTRSAIRHLFRSHLLKKLKPNFSFYKCYLLSCIFTNFFFRHCGFSRIFLFHELVLKRKFHSDQLVGFGIIYADLVKVDFYCHCQEVWILQALQHWYFQCVH